MYAVFQLRFYYHMYGAAIGNLNIYTRISLHGNLKQILSLSGNYGDAWMRKDIILQEKELFQVDWKDIAWCEKIVCGAREGGEQTCLVCTYFMLIVAQDEIQFEMKVPRRQ